MESIEDRKLNFDNVDNINILEQFESYSHLNRTTHTDSNDNYNYNYNYKYDNDSVAIQS